MLFFKTILLKIKKKFFRRCGSTPAHKSFFRSPSVSARLYRWGVTINSTTIATRSVWFVATHGIQRYTYRNYWLIHWNCFLFRCLRRLCPHLVYTRNYSRYSKGAISLSLIFSCFLVFLVLKFWAIRLDMIDYSFHQNINKQINQLKVFKATNRRDKRKASRRKRLAWSNSHRRIWKLRALSLGHVAVRTTTCILCTAA